MNSVYKRYFLIILAAAALCLGSMMSSTLQVVGEIDSINAYVAKNGSTEGFEFEYVSQYVMSNDIGGERIYYPYFEGAAYKCENNQGDNLWIVALSLVTVLLYRYERSGATGDLWAVFPVKSRGRFAVKAAGLLIIALAVVGANLWSVSLYNSRLEDMLRTCEILQMESIYPISYNLRDVLTSLGDKALTGAIFLLFGEMSGKAYLPPCLFVLALYGVVGSLSGLYNYMDYYFDIGLPFTGVINFRRVYYSVAMGYITAAIKLGAAALIGLWGLFLSGRGDMSRKDSLFRFRWVENIAVLCVVVCAALCGFEIIYLFELNYSIGAALALMIMLFVGAAAYYISRRIIGALGR